MNRTLIVISFLASTIITNAQISFESTSWSQIKEKAKKENKLIFLDAYTTWCGPCKQMAANTFTDKEVAEYYNTNFINAKIDMEKGEGIDIAKQYEVYCYPNLLFIDGDGKMIHRSGGSLKPAEFIALGKTAQTPPQTFSTMQALYPSRKNDHEFAAMYITKLSSNCLSTFNEINEYFKSLDNENWVTQTNWNLIRKYVNDAKSEVFKQFYTKREAFASKFTTDSINQKIFDTYLNEIVSDIYRKKATAAEIDSYKTEIKKSGFDRTNELFTRIDKAKAEAEENINAYFQHSKTIIDKYTPKEWFEFNEISWNVFEKSNNKAHLLEAEAWAKKSIELNENAYNLDTYAQLLNKNGKKKEAIEAEKKAIELAKKQDPSMVEELENSLKEMMKK